MLLPSNRFDIFGLLAACVASTVSATRYLGEVSMDQMEDCQQVRRPKHDVVIGDVYIVKSDGYSGKATSDQRQPAECSVGFNFGDRLLTVTVVDWACDRPYTEPFLSVYGDCDGRRKTLLAHWNCSTPKPVSDIYSFTSCLSLYHFRGHRKGGYYFTLHVVAGEERITFPAGGIAAVVLATVVVVMVVAKMICVATGYESRLPNVECGGDNGEEDENQLQKRIYTNSRSSLGVSSPTSDRQVAPQVRPAATDPVLVGEDISYAARSDMMTGRVHPDQPPRHHHQPLHPSLCIMRSNGSIASAYSSPCAAAEAELAANCNVDLDFLDLPSDDGHSSRVKRYPSARASNMWRRK